MKDGDLVRDRSGTLGCVLYCLNGLSSWVFVSFLVLGKDQERRWCMGRDLVPAQLDEDRSER